VQAFRKALDVLVVDLERNIKLLGTPERAQVLLAAMQSQLLGDSRIANTLIPRVCNAVLAAPSSTRHVRLPAAAVPAAAVPAAAVPAAAAAAAALPSLLAGWLAAWLRLGMCLSMQRDCAQMRLQVPHPSLPLPALRCPAAAGQVVGGVPG
jgi:hypothetical protein